MKQFLHDLIPGIKLVRKILQDVLKTFSYLSSPKRIRVTFPPGLNQLNLNLSLGFLTRLFNYSSDWWLSIGRAGTQAGWLENLKVLTAKIDRINPVWHGGCRRASLQAVITTLYANSWMDQECLFTWDQIFTKDIKIYKNTSDMILSKVSQKIF